VSEREQIALALRALANQGFFEFPFGHLSVRTARPEDGPILIVRHLHGEPLQLQDVTPLDIVSMSFGGEPLGGADVPGERYLHSAVYERRPDVTSVLHYHSTLTAAFGLLGRELVPRTPLAPVLSPAIGVHSYGGQIDSAEKGASLCDSLGDRPVALLPGHGAVVVGTGVEEVAARALALEDCCRIELAAAQLDHRAAQPPAERADASGSAEVTFVLWNHLVRTLSSARTAEQAGTRD
jgi:ribulose-5-phosphate 4-epimerase/fuculose-1-phosphate aldolase